MKRVRGTSHMQRYDALFMRLRNRHTILVDSVKHNLSIWNYVKGTKRFFCYLLDPQLEDLWYRRYTCVSCARCLELYFLNCTHEGSGEWKFKRFEIQSGILYSVQAV